MTKQIYVNMPVKNLKKSIQFFTKLGFTFNQKFTDENATCMIISENIFVMLLVENFFKSFIKKDICDAHKDTEVLMGITAESKASVNEIVKKAVDSGGRETKEPQDHGWMYTRSFEDLDGHIWEIFYLNESAFPEKPNENKLS